MHYCRTLLYIIIVLLLSNIFSVMVLSESVSTSKWPLENNCFLTFAPTSNFTNIPNRGITSDSSMVGYWNMNEGSGAIVNDSSVYGNAGIIYDATWGNGIYGTALNFNGAGNYIKIPHNDSLNVETVTIMGWVLINDFSEKAGSHNEITCKTDYDSLRFFINRDNHKLNCVLKISGSTKSLQGNSILSTNTWYFVALTFDGHRMRLYVNGVLDASSPEYSGSLDINNKDLLIGKFGSQSFFNGTIDELQIFNRSLNANELSTFYAIGDPQPFQSYFKFQDTLTNYTMLIFANNTALAGNDTSIINCTNLFLENNIVFKTNSSVILNLWTDLGKPIFIQGGLWNTQNNTTTLEIDNSSIGVLDWNRVPPNATNVSITTKNAGNTTTFSTLWSDNSNVLGGGYIFSTNNSGIWVNSTWAPFTSNPGWGNITLSLNSTVGINIGFREFANNSLNIWGDNGIYAIKTIATSPPTSTSSPTSTPMPTVTITPTPIPTPTLAPITTPIPTPNSTQTTIFSVEAILIIIVIIVAVSVFAFTTKTGYITVEVVDEKTDILRGYS